MLLEALNAFTSECLMLLLWLFFIIDRGCTNSKRVRDKELCALCRLLTPLHGFLLASGGLDYGDHSLWSQILTSPCNCLDYEV